MNYISKLFVRYPIREISIFYLTTLVFVTVAFSDGPYGDVAYRRMGVHDGNLIATIYFNQGDISGWHGWGYPPPRIEWPKGSGHEYGDENSLLIAAEVIDIYGQTIHIVSESSLDWDATDIDPITGQQLGWEPLPGYFNPNQDSPAMSHLPDTWPDLATTHSIYRTFDGGQNWSPADSGLGYYYSGQRYFNRLDRFFQYQNRILGGGMGIYYTSNLGDIWQRYWGEGDGMGLEINSFVHNKLGNELWIVGETGYFQEFLANSTDSGMTWEQIDLTKLIPHDNAVYSIAFDPSDADVVYVGMQGAIIKTTDGGDSWIVPLVTNPKGEFFRAILSDPRNPAHLWAAGGPDLIETWDAGTTWKPVESPIPETTKIFHMILDQKTQEIYLGTLNGVYRFKP